MSGFGSLRLRSGAAIITDTAFIPRVFKGPGGTNKTLPPLGGGTRRPEAAARHKQTWTHHRARPSVLEGIELSLLPQSFIEFLVQRANLIRYRALWPHRFGGNCLGHSRTKDHPKRPQQH